MCSVVVIGVVAAGRWHVTALTEEGKFFIWGWCVCVCARARACVRVCVCVDVQMYLERERDSE
jgi:hypothetical protein